ncbi:DUF309 domain-containing protein [Rossellomorea aquimaris]|uniref:DUF309 domain-containing protein n=1 Tax=Rossellomorea aquimaris TaxID=189382 RepID=UPI001CD5001E|nr:DUF309 domain-containing protein [Rossellomorea aquimaris]MCA1054698.1 DUF309 domain-containing protein [Rossellomorea aquimaris]
MTYPDPYVEYLVYFHGNRDYFECHEVLEEYWKEVDPGNRSSHWVGFIQIAVGLYHYRRDNVRGAKRMITKAITNLKEKQQHVMNLGLDHSSLISILESILDSIDRSLPYKSIDLPITDPLLIKKAVALSEAKGYEWCLPSDLSNMKLIHRHSMRDRSDVITERQNALKKKKRLT